VEIASVGAALDPVKASEAGKKLAMHIVAAKPLYLDRDSVPNEIVEREEAILLSQVSETNIGCVLYDAIVGSLRDFETTTLNMVCFDIPVCRWLILVIPTNRRKF
jgi:translation elongation factor EF-Ts